jgi:hypothetical protein
MANSHAIHGDTRTPKPLALCSRIPQAAADALGNQAAFQFSHGT